MSFQSLLTASMAIAFVVACTDGTPAREDTTAADRRAIEALGERHIAAAKGKDLEAFLATVTDDFLWMPPNGPSARGEAEVRASSEAFFKAFTITHLEFPSSELQIENDLAIKHYTYDWTLTPAGGGAAVRDTGNGIYVYRRQADGSWKIAYDIWTSNQATGRIETQ